ncbi:MAG: type I methionyl aminopeptidase [Clostridia bacterium]|nr:type I methionyl aminopeptidase [Clostridia bacterium]
MIYIKSKTEIELMRQANQLVKHTLEMLIEATKEGVSTLALDKMAYEFIVKYGATPSFLRFNGYPASICISIDDEVVHGIPNKHKILAEGSIVSYDCGVILNGWHGDATRTVGVGRITADKQRLIDVTEQCFYEGIKVIQPNTRLGDVGQAIQQYAESHGYGVVRELCGHGIGRNMHEDPNVPNYGVKGRGLRLSQGMTIAIEPMINMGSHKVMTMSDGWTVKTQDGLPSAHYENTLAITDNGVDILSI